MDQTEYIAHLRDKEPRSQSVEKHLLETAVLAKRYASVAGLGGIGELLGLLHDLGKYSSDFQQYIKSLSGFYDQDHDDDSCSQRTEKNKQALSMKGKIDHSTAGAQFVWQQLGCNKKDWIKLTAAEMLAVILAGHHGGLMDISSEGDDLFLKRMKKEDGKTHLTEVATKISPEVRDRVDKRLASCVTISKLKKLILNIKVKEQANT